ncbi:MAG: hypothetical protein AB7I59_04640 [Geminicoccaceae bacterium]
MTETATFGADGRTLTVRLPITLRKRGGRKAIVTPDGSPAWAPHRARVDSTLVKALARAFRWRTLLETGVYGTVSDLAAVERINPSYVSRVLRLTLLAPEIVEAVLDGRQAAELTLAALMEPFAVEWQNQREV